MPNAAMCWAYEHKLPHLEKWTLVLISDWADQDGFGSTTIPRLSAEGGMTNAQAESALLELHKLGVLKILQVPEENLDRKYTYKLDWRMD